MQRQSSPEGAKMLARKPSSQTSKKPPRPAKPSGETDLAALRHDLKAKFSKTIARLAK